MSYPDGPRVLHVLRKLDRGGIETWLLHVLRNTQRGAWQPEFLLQSTEPGAYDEEIRALGGVLHYCTTPHQPVRYTRELRRILRNTGPYHVVHSHVHLYSGIVLRAAHAEGVPVRIAHAHYAGAETRRLYAAVMRRLIRKHATHCLAVSNAAAAALFGSGSSCQAHSIIHEFGLDYSRFEHVPPRDACKQALGIPRERTVIGSVARFVPEKNQAFIVSVFAALLHRGVDAQLLLVGSGPLEAAVRRQLDSMGLSARSSLVGAHDDVARFFGAMDVLVFPSLSEGLGLAALEAQAAAVPVLASDTVPREVQVIPGLLQFRPLADGADSWADGITRLLCTAPTLSRAATSRALSDSRYGVARSARSLAGIYGAAT